MDAYDIFKKLTKGLTFKHRVLGVKNNVSMKPDLSKLNSNFYHIFVST